MSKAYSLFPVAFAFFLAGSATLRAEPVETDSFAIEASASDDLLFELARKGTARRLETSETKELAAMVECAATHARSLDLGCRRTGVYEVLIKKAYPSGRTRKVRGGYQVAYWCEDAPSPSLGLYFDNSQKFLGSIDRSEL